MHLIPDIAFPITCRAHHFHATANQAGLGSTFLCSLLVHGSGVCKESDNEEAPVPASHIPFGCPLLSGVTLLQSRRQLHACNPEEPAPAGQHVAHRPLLDTCASNSGCLLALSPKRPTLDSTSSCQHGPLRGLGCPADSFLLSKRGLAIRCQRGLAISQYALEGWEVVVLATGTPWLLASDW
jgi:hypothetical protein